MSIRWKEIARLRFKGERFADHALDAAALGEVQQFLRVIENTAKALWRADNPDRERLPAGFDEENRAFLRQVQRGSAVAVIQARVKDDKQTEFVDLGAEAMSTAAEFTQSVYTALAQGKPLPQRLPKDLVSQYAELGKSLGTGEVLEIKAASKKQFVTYRPEYRQRWETFAPRSFEDRLTLIGEIVEADVRQERFQIWMERNAAIPAPFKPEQEAFVTTALKDHRAVRVQISGRAEFSADGKPVRFLEVGGLSLAPTQGLLFDANARSIEEEIEAIWKDVPDSEWAKVPSDLSDNLDHYLYGSPKK